MRRKIPGTAAAWDSDCVSSRAYSSLSVSTQVGAMLGSVNNFGVGLVSSTLLTLVILPILYRRFGIERTAAPEAQP